MSLMAFVTLLLVPVPLSAADPTSSVGATEEPAITNKLLYMYRLYYLPFSVEFRQGKTKDDILPFIQEKNAEGLRLLRAEELQNLDSEWNAIKDPWKQKSLLQGTNVPLNQTVALSSHLYSHHVGISRNAFDSVSLNDRIVLTEKLKGKPPEVQASFKQLTFVKSFLSAFDQERFNFFIFSASWCDSCKEYRVLLESLVKNFPEQNLNLHSVMIEDTKEEIFEKPILKELFPNPKKYSHESIPRFLSFEVVNGVPTVLEEGEALKALYERFLKVHRGYLDSKSALFKSGKPLTPDRHLSSSSK